MHTMRQTNGLSGFTKRSESEYDSFGTGHSSTTISAGLGNSSLYYLSLKLQFEHLNIDTTPIYVLHLVIYLLLLFQIYILVNVSVSVSCPEFESMHSLRQ